MSLEASERCEQLGRGRRRAQGEWGPVLGVNRQDAEPKELQVRAAPGYSLPQGFCCLTESGTQGGEGRRNHLIC